MSKALDLLNSLSEEEIAQLVAQPDPEGHIVVGGDRVIRVPTNLRRIGVEHDHDIETVTFDCPKTWDKNDLSQMVIYINYKLSNGYKDRYPAQNVVADGDVLHFDWTISRNVTQVKGPVSFNVCAVQTEQSIDEESGEFVPVEVLHWNSELNQEMYVSEGMECEESPMDTYPDIVTELLGRYMSAEDIEQLRDECEDKMEYCEKLAQDCWSAFYEVETTRGLIDASASEIRNSYANAIKGNVSGEIVRVDDVSPLEHDVKCWVHGKNLFDASKLIVTDPSPSYAYVSEIGDGYIVVTTEDGYDGNGYCTIPKTLREVCPGLQTGKTYVLNAETESNSANVYLPGILESWVFGTSKVMTEEILNSTMTFYGLSVLAGMGTGSCRISNIQIEEGSIATNYESYIDPTTVTVHGCGKNVLNLSGNKTQNGVSMTVDDNGLITVKGTSTASINMNVGSGRLKAGCKYRPVIQKLKSDVAPSFWNFEHQANINKDKDGYISSDVDAEFSAFVYTASAGTVYDAMFKVMVELVTDNTAGAYESYKDIEPQTAASDGSCAVRSVGPTMTVFTDTPGAIVEVEYNRDTTKMFESYVLTPEAKTEIAGIVESDLAEVLSALNKYTETLTGGGS